MEPELFAPEARPAEQSTGFGRRSPGGGVRRDEKQWDRNNMPEAYSGRFRRYLYEAKGFPRVSFFG